jgi:hypothetical protein
VASFSFFADPGSGSRDQRHQLPSLFGLLQSAENRSCRGRLHYLLFDFSDPFRSDGFFRRKPGPAGFRALSDGQGSCFQRADQCLAEGIARLLERANDFLADYNYAVTGDEIRNAVTEVAKFVGLFLYDQARAIASNTLAFVVNFFLMLLVIYFLLLDGKRLVSYIVDLSPLPSDQEHKLIGRSRR